MNTSVESTPSWTWWVLGITIAAILTIGIWSLTREKANSRPTATVITATPTPTSQTLELKPKEWTEVSIPRRHEFRTDPADTVVVRNLLGEEFMKTPDGTIIRMADTVRVEGFGTIPGLKLKFRAHRRPTTMVFSYWPYS